MTAETQSYCEVASHLPPRAVVSFHDVSWEEYERLLEELGDATGLRISYNDWTLKIMTLSSEHENFARFFESLITVIRLRLGWNIRSFGSATMKKQTRKKGSEPDACFYVQNAGIVGNKMQIDFAIDPPPDIVVEVDIHHDSLDKFSIYAALGVPEIWRFDGEELTIHRLQDDQYAPVQSSLALPMLSASTLTRFLARLPKDGESQTLVAFDEWLQSSEQ